MPPNLTLRKGRTESQSLSQALDSFLADAAARRLAPKTISYYQFEISRFITSSSVQTLSELEASHIRTYLSELNKRGLKGSSVHASARALKAWLNWCVRESLLSANPMHNVRMPQVDRELLPALSKDDIETLLEVADSIRDRAIILCLLDSGCRAAEFVALNIGDVNRRTGEVTVKRGKNRKSRTTFFGPRARKELFRYLYSRSGDQNAPLFASEHAGQRLTVSGLEQILRRLGQATGIHITPHALRRTCALWCHRSGWRLTEIQRLLGHSDLTVLLRYLDLDDSDVGNVFGKAPPTALLS